jgi:hypothetical protein
MLVTVKSHAGIANRIKNIMSALSQHDEVGTLHDTMHYIFPSLTKVEETTNSYEEDWRLYVSPEENEQYNNDYKTIDLLYEKTPSYFVEKYLKVLDRLKINPDIVEYVNDFTKDWNNMAGVHIRSWYCQKRRFHSNDIFEEQIDKLNSEKFFFCSDNSDVQDYFIQKYGDKVITYDRQVFNQPHLAESGHHDNVQLTTDAFIELLILSRCSTIIGTYDSTFDEVAWWFSGCKSKVIIPQPKNFDQQYHDSQFIKK